MITKEMISERIRTRIKDWRRLNNLSQKAAADILGINHPNLNEIESGVYTPGLSTILQICNGTGIPIDFLLREDPTPPEDIPRMVHRIQIQFDQLQRNLIQLYGMVHPNSVQPVVGGDGHG